MQDVVPRQQKICYNQMLTGLEIDWKFNLAKVGLETVQMKQKISYCGLICRTCPIYLATMEIDQAKRKKMRAEIAEQCNKMYGTEYGTEDINDCDGCRTEGGRLFSGCKTCLIRSCARDKGLENCACCSEYACEQLLKFLALESEAKRRLEQIKSGR